MDRPICRDFIIAGQGNFILRLNKTTKLIYNGKETPVNKISRKMPSFMELTAIKTKKNKKHKVAFMGGAVKVKYKIKGKIHDLWFSPTGFKLKHSVARECRLPRSYRSAYFLPSPGLLPVLSMFCNADFASSLANSKQVLIGLAHRKIRWWNVACCKVCVVLRHSGQSGLHSKCTGKPGQSVFRPDIRFAHILLRCA